MRKSRERLRVKRETLRSLTPRLLERVAGGSWGGDPAWGETLSDHCWSDSQTYSGGSRYC